MRYKPLKKDYMKFCLALYIIALGFILISTLYLLKNNAVQSELNVTEQSLPELVFYSQNNIPIYNLNDLTDINSEYIYAYVNEDIPNNIELNFRSKHVYFNICKDDTENIVYEHKYNKSLLYTKSNGVEWHSLNLEQFKGHFLIIKYELIYSEKKCGFDNIKLCEANIYNLNLIKHKALALFLSTIYIAISIVIIILDFLAHKVLNERHNLLYLGLVSLAVASYCIMETQAIQIFANDKRLIHLLGMYTLSLIPSPCVLYAESMFGFKFKKTPLIFSIINASMFGVAVALNISRLADYHESLLLIHIPLVSALTLLIYSMIRNIIFNKYKNKYTWAMITGLSIITLSGLTDMLRYYLKLQQDPAKFIRIGFLGFLLCFSIASSDRILSAFQKASENKLIARLAYQDGLTGLLNRTSYIEKINEIQEKNIPCIITMMDVNNLKTVNDTLGHERGDEMLKFTAELLQETFCEVTDAYLYRIGGDEFVSIILNTNIDIEKYINILKAKYNEFNEFSRLPYKIIIAAGSAYCINDNINTVIDIADKLMYNNKKTLKGQEPR